MTISRQDQCLNENSTLCSILLITPGTRFILQSIPVNRLPQFVHCMDERRRTIITWIVRTSRKGCGYYSRLLFMERIPDRHSVDWMNASLYRVGDNGCQVVCGRGATLDIDEHEFDQHWTFLCLHFW